MALTGTIVHISMGIFSHGFETDDFSGYWCASWCATWGKAIEAYSRRMDYPRVSDCSWICWYSNSHDGSIMETITNREQGNLLVIILCFCHRRIPPL
ncbi:MAG: hypothetical protein QG588_2105, partial [Candidatus Poribacteria bacterium]|nr:hypothetical protein [Candidatus Poribacteria bacterium]